MITILGSSGFVGSNLSNFIKSKNEVELYCPARGETLLHKNLGNVIYCIGLTADFRSKPFETVEAHVSLLSKIIQNHEFDSLTYLSSTRLYIKNGFLKKSVIEGEDISLNASDPYDLFAASKITGELLALNSGRKNIKIVRLSNVFGKDFNSQNFITSIVKDALINNRVDLFTTSDSEKDYIYIDDVCEALEKLALVNNTGIYNLAFGENTPNSEITDQIEKLTGANFHYSPSAQKIAFRSIDINKLRAEIDFNPTVSLTGYLPEIVSSFRNYYQK